MVRKTVPAPGSVRLIDTDEEALFGRPAVQVTVTSCRVGFCVLRQTEGLQGARPMRKLTRAAAERQVDQTVGRLVRDGYRLA